MVRLSQRFLNDRNREHILFAVIFLVAVLLRVIMFGSHPAGLNQDEASVGYDAWALMNDNIDRNGFSFPVHLMAWGSGQNALYAYFSMPFIALFGLNVFSVRIVNLIFSLLTVLAVYSTLKQAVDKRTAFIGMALTAAAPWNVMLARWGLESNLFPAMLMLSIWVLFRSTKNKRFFYPAAVILALSLYSYGSAYLVVTLFALACFVYCVVKKLVPVKTLIVGALVYVVISVPIYLFVYINVFELEGLQIGAMSIPRLYGNRIQVQNGATFFDFFKNLYHFVLWQTDNTERNAFQFYGCYYVISLPFLMAGIVRAVKKRMEFDFIVLLALICSVLLFCYYNAPNINRVNAIYMPLILLTSVGLGGVIKNKCSFALIFVSYTICLTGFSFRYFGSDYREYIGKEFCDGFEEALKKTTELSSGNKTVNIVTSNMPHIYTLFYTQTPPGEFLDTVVYENPGAMFQRVRSFSNYRFTTNFHAFNPDESGIYLLDASLQETAEKKTSEIYSHKNFIVAVIP